MMPITVDRRFNGSFRVRLKGLKVLKELCGLAPTGQHEHQDLRILGGKLRSVFLRTLVRAGTVTSASP